MAEKNCDACDKKGECPVSQEPQRPEESLEQFLEREELAKTLGQIKHKILVLSGKGGVGKSTVAVNMAVSLALDGHKVGLLDIDIHGPSVPKLLKLEGRQLEVENEKIVPASFSDNLKVVSIGFMLQREDDAVIWRGPMKMGVIKQFLKDVTWGELDFLIVDSPPGTGDEPLSICQLIPDADGAVVVTTPQQLAVVDVRKCVTFCSKLNTPVLGVVENMSGLVCPHCGQRIDVFKAGGGEAMATEMGVPYLGSIPLDPIVVEASDDGTPFAYKHGHSETAQDMLRIVRKVQAGLAEPAAGQASAADAPPEALQINKPVVMIALPTAQGKVCMHFGHADKFVFVKADVENKTILSTEDKEPPGHEPGVLPRWLSEQGVDIIIAGGMGSRAQGFFKQYGIDCVVGAPSDEAAKIVDSWLNGKLATGVNICDH